MPSDLKLEEKVRQIALMNAISHRGKAQQGPVIGKLLAENPDLRPKVKEIAGIVAQIVAEVNQLSLKYQLKAVGKKRPKELIQEKTKEEKTLPPLPNVDNYKTVVTRFSPNPDAPVHLGSARAIVLCHEYAERYRGRFLVRFEDTDPKLKKPELEFYEAIKKDLEWLGCKPNEYSIQSDRLPIYYEHAELLLNDGNAYVCTCHPEAFRNFVASKKPCRCRDLPPEEHLKRWKAMLNGGFEEGDAVVRVKTDLTHPNPAIRDWPALRIIDTKTYPHPRVGSKYRVWPLYNLACGVDDHLMGVTHIIRGKEHLTNQARQEFMYKHLGWTYPEAIHYGRLKISGASLSKSKLVQGMRSGLYTGWDDPRLATFAALRRRGIQPDAIRQLIIDVGPKTQDVTLSWENLYAHNRKIVEPKADRYFFVRDPKQLVVQNIPGSVTARIPLHPDYPDRGHRQYNIDPREGSARFLVAARDVERMKKGYVMRLMGLFNVSIQALSDDVVRADFHSSDYEDAKAIAAPLIHWIPEGAASKGLVVMPDASMAKGLVEDKCKEAEVGTIVQFERFGFARIDSNQEELTVAYYCHR